MGKRSSGLTKTDVLVVTGIIGILTLLSLPMLQAVEGNKDQVNCAANLKNLYQGLTMYCEDNEGVLPPASKWKTAVSKYLNRDEEDGFGCDYMRCPAASPDIVQTYGVNYWFVISDIWWGKDSLTSKSRKLSCVPATTFICADAVNYLIYNHLYYSFKLEIDTDGDGIVDSSKDYEKNKKGQYKHFSPRHDKGGNFLFADGSVKWVSLPDYLSNKEGMMGSADRSEFKKEENLF